MSGIHEHCAPPATLKGGEKGPNAMNPALQPGPALVGVAPIIPKGEQLSNLNRELVPSSRTITAPSFSYLHFSNRELLTSRRAPPRQPGGRNLGPAVIRQNPLHACIDTRRHSNPSYIIENKRPAPLQIDTNPRAFSLPQISRK